MVPPASDVLGLTREAVVAAMAEGPDAVLALFARALAPVLERLAALEAARAKDRHNSSKPPSTDTTRAGRAPRSLRSASGRARGGQPGHPGRTLALRAAPDVLRVHAPAACAACGAGCVPAAPSTPVRGERRQVFELPPVALNCTEHRLAERTSARCGGVSRGAYPPEARSTAQYGPGLLAFGLYLTTHQLLPVARAAGLTRCAVLHLDETAFYVGDLTTGGPCARWWLHVDCTPTLTHYTAHPRRGTVAHAAVGLLPAYAGTAVHDSYASYGRHTGCRHALCGAHATGVSLLRELTFLAEEEGPATRGWAAAFKRALQAMKRSTRPPGAATVGATTPCSPGARRPSRPPGPPARGTAGAAARRAASSCTGCSATAPRCCASSRTSPSCSTTPRPSATCA